MEKAARRLRTLQRLRLVRRRHLGFALQHSAKDADGNVAPAENMLYDTKGCIVKVPAGKLAVIEGLEDYIVVDSGDVLMICPKSGEQNIKKFIDDVKFKIGDRFI